MTAAGAAYNATPGSAEHPYGAMAHHERAHYRSAANWAMRIYPGDVGELLAREFLAFAEFGYRVSVDALVPRLAAKILAKSTVPAEQTP